VNINLLNYFALGATIKINFIFFTSVKRILVLDGIPNPNLEIGSQKMTANIIALNANHSTIQQSHAEFLLFDQFVLDFMDNNSKWATKLKRNQKWVGLCTTLRKTLLFIKFDIPLVGFKNSTTNP
jgi:hypothetical protein